MSTFLAAGAIGRPRAAPEAVAPPAVAQRAKVGLSMYSDLPEGEIAIEEFERFAMDRLRGGCRALLVLDGAVGARGGLAAGEAGSSRCGRRRRPGTSGHLAPVLLLPQFSLPMAAVLKGIDDMKVKGFRPDQMQARRRPCMLHLPAVAGSRPIIPSIITQCRMAASTVLG